MYESLFSPKVKYWIGQLSRFISVQIFVQAMGFACGILLVRVLPKEEYAYFTLANSMQGAMNVLADSGVSSALSAIGGKVWQDPYRFGQLINTALKCRRYLAIVSVVVVTPILLWMLIRNGAPLRYAVVLIAGILLELNFYLTTGVRIVVLRLHSRIQHIQHLDLLFSGTRAVLLLGASFTYFNAAIGIFISTLASGLKNQVLKHWVDNTIDMSAPSNAEDQYEVLKLVRTQAPNTIFYCIQGQLTIWLISIFGNTQNIAEIGALSRLGVIFSIASSVLLNIVLPSFARCQNRNLLIRRYWEILSGYLLFSLCLILCAVFFPSQLLWILGEQYNHLQDEVFLIIVNSITHAIAAMLWTINSSRGWIELSWLFVPTLITTEVLLLLVLDISTVKGVILLSTLSIIPAACINFYMTYKGISKIQSH
ncbi:MAG: hypothetical protein WBA57_19325 [Elainellaceae cyanobacterium]